ncbi:MAG: PEP-CTERM sorting domain-containing protein [Armatimonadetes bacterium]|nr:PEP-CTERM sorting domain-containing protein [Armatimonadota bacterium]
MNKLISLALLVGVATASQAVILTQTYTLASVESWDSLGSANNDVIVLSLDSFVGSDNMNYVLTGLGWNLTITAVAPSWLSEVRTQFRNTSNTDGFNGQYSVANNSGTATYTSSGIVDLIGLGLDLSMDADEMLTLEFFESADDNANWIDAYLSGSMTMQFSATPVPEPTSLAVLGLGALVMMRRRK